MLARSQSRALISSSLRVASYCFACSDSCCISYYIFDTFVLYICNFSYYIFGTFRIIYLQLFVLYIRQFLYYIFATFHIIHLQILVLYIRHFSYYIFVTFHIIYSTLFVLFNALRIIKSHFRITKLGYI